MIAILGHIRTGSRLLVHVLKACGMELGNEATGWKDNVGMDHPGLNTIGNKLFIGEEENADFAKDEVMSYLLSYRYEAMRHGWKHFGVKITHALQEPCWEVFKPAFKEVFPEAKFVVTLRDASAIIKRLDGVSGWTPDTLLESINSTLPATRELSGKAVFVHYPDTYEKHKISNVVRELGLEWKRKAGEIYTKGGVLD